MLCLAGALIRKGEKALKPLLTKLPRECSHHHSRIQSNYSIAHNNRNVVIIETIRETTGMNTSQTVGMNTSRQKIETVKMNTSRWFSLIVSINVSGHEVFILTISNVSIVASFQVLSF